MITKSERKLDVFFSFRKFFYILTVFTWENFRNPDRRIVRKNQAIAIGKAILLFGVLVSVVGAGWHCISYKFDLAEIALPFGLMFTTAQMLITYATMRIKHKQLANVIARLGEIINPLKLSGISLAAVF